MNHRRTFHGLGDPGRHRAGGSARPRALRWHRRRGHVRDRAGHAGSRRPGLRERRWVGPHAGRAGRAGRRRARGTRRRPPGPGRHRGGVQRHPAQQSGTGRGARPQPARAAPGRRAGFDHDRPPGHRDRRHPRQDHHHLDADHDPARVRGRSRLRDRRRAGRDRPGRRGRQWARPRGGGGRERRVVPHAVAVRGGDHQRRSRPPGQLFRAGRDPGRVRGLRPPHHPRRRPDHLRRRHRGPGGGRGVPGPGHPGPQLRRGGDGGLPGIGVQPARDGQHVRADGGPRQC